MASDGEQTSEVEAQGIERVAGFISRLIEEFGAKTYLEIGVNRGETFNNVRAPYKEGVDPKFRFDTAAYESADTLFFAESSDQYFARFPYEKRDKFDVIFIDGLHTFEQTYRDFLNTLDVSHDRTIWLIDDTVPSDAFSIWQNQREAVELRRLANTSRVKPGAWQGDVFKLVFAIHDFMPAFSFATLTDRGKQQTIAWRERRTTFKPLFNSLDTISRMSFLDFLLHRETMNLCSSKGIFDRIREGWARCGWEA